MGVPKSGAVATAVAAGGREDPGLGASALAGARVPLPQPVCYADDITAFARKMRKKTCLIDIFLMQLS